MHLLRKTNKHHEKLNKNSGYPSQDLNQVPPIYGEGMLPGIQLVWSSLLI
jgi:hypothetical protein